MLLRSHPFQGYTQLTLRESLGSLILFNLNFIYQTSSLKLYTKYLQMGNMLFKLRVYGTRNQLLVVSVDLSWAIVHFGKRYPDGHLGFAVALEMLKGMNLFWHLGLFWTQFLAGYLFLYTN